MVRVGKTPVLSDGEARTLLESIPVGKIGSLEDARAIAGHESSQTTRLYDRTGERITLDEIERIRF